MGTTNLKVFVSDVDNVISSYDVIRIRRSVSGLAGPYTEITAASPENGFLVAPNTAPYDVVGKTLKVKINDNPEVDVVFSGGLEPLTVSDVIDQVNSFLPGVASEEVNALRLASPEEGTASKVEIGDGGANFNFGWVEGDRDIGEEPYILLVASTTVYSFADNDGESGYYYQASFYNTTNGNISAWSDPFQGDVGTLLEPSNLSTGTIDLVDARGVAVPEQRITFYAQGAPLQVGQYQVALVREPVTIETDNSGHAEVTLVRGLDMRVVFEGTSIIRDITIPDAATFDILALISNAQDSFDVVEPNYPAAPRRTL